MHKERKINMWSEIRGYDGFYEVSGKGKVRSWRLRNGRSSNKTESPRLLKSFLDKDGYRKYGLSKDGKTKQYRACRLVAIAFIPNPENKPQVNHIDGVKDNDSVENLEWSTAKENVNHSIDTGLRTHDHMMGAENHMSKLSTDDILDIKNAYRLGCFTHQEISDAYNVSRQHISSIISGKKWSYL